MLTDSTRCFACSLSGEMSEAYQSTHAAEYDLASGGGGGGRVSRLPPQVAQSSPTLDPRRRPAQAPSHSDMDGGVPPGAGPPWLTGAGVGPSRLPTSTDAEGYSPLAPSLPFGTVPSPQPARPMSVPRPGPQQVMPAKGAAAGAEPSPEMRPPSAPAAVPGPAPSALRGVGYMDPARLALLASAGGGSDGQDEPTQLDAAAAAVVGVARPTAAEQKARADEAARNAWGARRAAPASTLTPTSTGGEQQEDAAPQLQDTGSQAASSEGTRPRALSLGIKGVASGGSSSSAGGEGNDDEGCADSAALPSVSAGALQALEAALRARAQNGANGE
ncbi:hypothetical protein DMC30DRAFT_132792 [Rhodotorula diobovata]|uniref:Uncharacterized protein n=1 Tax=Rhodotorula diobovata TaxID=5288 RepID=A0A5C5FKE9_9BASI|nr:hypothetical protein DMC30DRAFT_132792 [Rhodotorula diobovata]